MADGVVEASEPYKEFDQDMYDRAAWDYLNWLNGLTSNKRERVFKESNRLDSCAAHPKPAVRCTKCGNTVLERKWSSSHTDWQCLEATCREFSEWKAS